MLTFAQLVLVIAIAAASSASMADEPNNIDSIVETTLGPELRREMEGWDHAMDEARRKQAEVLAARGDPESLLTAVLFYPRQWHESDEKSGVEFWFSEAVRRNRESRLVAWIQATNCPLSQEAQCDRDGALALLRRLDPENGAVWLELANDAKKRDEKALADAYFRRAANAPRFDVYDVELGQLLLRGINDFQPPPVTPEVAVAWAAVAGIETPLDAKGIVEIHALGVLITQVIPGLQEYYGWCVRNDLPQGDAGRQALCRQLFTIMADTATMVLIESIALNAMLTLTRGTAENDRWRERYRRYFWQRDQIVALQKADPNPLVEPIPGYARTVLEKGELPAWRALIEYTGRDLEPPGDWLPNNTYERSRVLDEPFDPES